MSKKASLTEDALLRMLVGALAGTIAKILALRTAGQFQEAIYIIEDELEELLGLKANLVRRLRDQQIVEMLMNNEHLDVGRLYAVAELFRQEGEIHAEMGEDDLATTSQIRALNLFLEVVFAVDDSFHEADQRVDLLADHLDEHIPEDTLFALYDYYDQCGEFSRAEKILMRMLVATENNPDIAAEQRAFYTRLLAERDEELQAGGVSREDIQQKMKAL